MKKWQEMGLAAALGAVAPTLLGAMWLGKLENRVAQLEESLSEVITPDPVRSQCAKLATALANQTEVPLGSSDPDFIDNFRSRIQDAMNALGCIRAN